MKVLVVDIGGTSVRILATAQHEGRKCPSGRTLTPRHFVTRVKKLAGNWKYDVVSIGYPGRVVDDRPVTEPKNLARGWVGFDFEAAFGCPVKMVNDAAMQALGSFRGGTLLFLSLGTGVGSALVMRGNIVPMDLGALPYGTGTVEDYLGTRGLKKLGREKWQETVELVAERFRSALLTDECVMGGGNAKQLTAAPPGCRIADNKAFLGGFRLWRPARFREFHSQATPSRHAAA